jgi:anthranilate phosphoribosyltransferase
MTPDVPLIRKLMARQDLSRRESAALLGSLLRNDPEGWRFLAFSVASLTKGETLEELLGMFDALREVTAPYDVDLPSEVIDVASGGGSGVRKINVSTLTALVAGEPDMPVAKQSFWGITSVTGSADVLREVGIFVPALTVPQLGQAIHSVGVVFYSPLFLSGELCNLVHFGQVLGEKAIGVNTPFNLVAPIFTPIPLTCRMFGANHHQQLEMLHDLFQGLGFRAALTFHGGDGLDEVSLCAPTRMRGFRDGEELEFVLTPEQVGLKTVPAEAVQPHDARSNVRDFLRIVHGLETGPKRDLVALNGGVAFWLTGRTATIEEGVQRAVTQLESGRIAEKLATLVELLGDPEVLRRTEREHLPPRPR